MAEFKLKWRTYIDHSVTVEAENALVATKIVASEFSSGIINENLTYRSEHINSFYENVEVN